MQKGLFLYFFYTKGYNESGLGGNMMLFLMEVTSFTNVLHEWMSVLVNLFVVVLELMGLIVIAWASLNAFVHWIKKDPQTRLHLAEGLAMALEFKLGSEILRTVIVRDMTEIIQVGCIILLRAALTFLIHWEIKNEEKAHIDKMQVEQNSVE